MIPLAERAIGILGKVVRVETETPFQAVRRFHQVRTEAREVARKLEWRRNLVRMGMFDGDERVEVRKEIVALKTRRQELFLQENGGIPGIRTEIVLLDGRLGRRSFDEATRTNTPRLEPVRAGRVHPVPEG